jgi:hypothetical protein
MKTTKITLGLVTLIALLAINGFVNNVSAQRPIPLPKCTATVDQIYFVASGQMVTEVHPGSNGGNGYQLNILGTGADKFWVVKEPYMTSVSVIPNYTNATQAKWQIYFNPRMGQKLTSVKLGSKCTGRAVHVYPLTVNVTLLDQ